jgi:hypothetical protein
MLRSRRIIVLILILLVSIFIVTNNNYSKSSSIYTQSSNTKIIQSHASVQASIRLAEQYIDSLYKDDYPNEVAAPNQAAIGEYRGTPLNIRMSDGSIIRVGEDVKLTVFFSPIASILWSTTSVTNEHNSRYLTTYDVTFRKQESFISIQDIGTLHVEINHNYKTGTVYGTKVTVFQESFHHIKSISYADVYLGTTYIGRATPDKNGQIIGTYTYLSNNDPNARSMRYTERHSSQLGYEWYYANGNYSKAAKLVNNLIYKGYQIHKDIYSPLFRTDTRFDDNYLFEGGPSGVYCDCYTESPMGRISYQYHSKVCSMGEEQYLWFSRDNDWLVPTLWAIHLLNKYHSPDTPYYNGYSWWSPREVARFDETKWIKIGIHSPYDKQIASSVRTAVFEVLETILGYHYGDATSKEFADKSVEALLSSQVRSDGIISEYDADLGIIKLYQRKESAGAFYTAWKEPFLYVTSMSPIKQLFQWIFNQPDESGDIKPSNAETTITNAQALRTYDCYKYGHNCVNTPS